MDGLGFRCLWLLFGGIQAEDISLGFSGILELRIAFVWGFKIKVGEDNVGKQVFPGLIEFRKFVFEDPDNEKLFRTVF